MSLYQYKTSQFIPVDLITAWGFFSTPLNLPIITPPELGLKILTKAPVDKTYQGMKIEYIVRPFFNIPVRWQTEISTVVDKKQFIDKQLKGPYRLWEHTHIFEEQNGGVLMTDIVNYELPFGFLGDIIHSLFIRKKIEYIFSYRRIILDNQLI